MTYCTSELAARGVAEVAIVWRQWRRRTRLSQVEAATMADIHVRTLIAFELGEYGKQATIDKLQALMARWQEHMRPVRPAERRGGWQRKRREKAAAS